MFYLWSMLNDMSLAVVLKRKILIKTLVVLTVAYFLRSVQYDLTNLFLIWRVYDFGDHSNRVILHLEPRINGKLRRRLVRTMRF